MEDLYARYLDEGTEGRRETFQNAVRGYIADTGKDWEDLEIYLAENELADEYSRAASTYLSALGAKKYYAGEIELYGDAYKLAQNPEKLKADLDSLSLRIHTANEAYQSAADIYGSMADKHIIMMQILETKQVGETHVPSKVSVQLQLTDPELKSRDRVVKKSEKSGLYDAMDVGAIWLERALSGK